MSHRCVFLDRDGVINVKAAPGDYIRRWSEFRLLPGIVDWIALFNVLDLLVIVITNQRGVARGLIRAQDLDEIHRNMVAELDARRAHIDDVYCCPHELNTCECRKPKPGLVLQAKAKWNIDLAGSLLIGDTESDRLLAKQCGMRFVEVANGSIVRRVAEARPGPSG